MTKEVIATKDAPAAIGPYSQAIRAGHAIYCSGQVALDPATGAIVEGGVAEQTERVLANLEAVLRVGGAGLADVVKTTVYLKDLGAFSAMNEVYARVFGDWKPARATVEVSRLPKDALVEIDCVAVIGP